MVLSHILGSCQSHIQTGMWPKTQGIPFGVLQEVRHHLPTNSSLTGLWSVEFVYSVCWDHHTLFVIFPLVLQPGNLQVQAGGVNRTHFVSLFLGIAVLCCLVVKYLRTVALYICLVSCYSCLRQESKLAVAYSTMVRNRSV